MSTINRTPLEYFATLEGPEFGRALFDRVKQWDEYLSSSDFFRKLRDAGRNYFGNDGNGTMSSRITPRGENANVSSLKANHLRPVVRNILTFLLSEQPKVKPVARTTDASAQAQTLLAKSRLDHYQQEEGLEARLFEAAEMALVLSLGWTSGKWDETKKTDDAQEGDLVFESHLPTDVIFELEHAGGVEGAPWKVLRTYVNKYELAAEYEARALQAQLVAGEEWDADKDRHVRETVERIKGLHPDKDELRLRIDFGGPAIESARKNFASGDVVPVYEFFHAPTLAVPAGRYAKFAAADVELLPGDGRLQPLGYDSIPLWPVYDSRIFGSAWTHTSVWDGLALQRAIDIFTSIPVSNHKMLGLQNIAVPEGCDIDIARISQGFNLIHYRPGPQGGKPEAIQWAQTSPETFAFRQQLISEMGQILGGLNDVSRGMEQRDLSGAALVMLDAVSARFSKPFTRAYRNMLKRVAIFIIRNLQKRVQTPRMARISGGSESPIWREWQGSDLTEVTTVDVEEVSALSQSAAGRMQLADNLLEHNAVSPKQYVGVLETGRLEVMTEAPEKLRLQVKRENEDLAKGLPVPVSPSDNHPAHIQEHAADEGEDERRPGNEAIMMNRLQHIQAHMDAWRSADPGLLAALGVPPPPPPVPMPAMPVPPPGAGAPGPRPPPAPAQAGPPGGPPPATPGAPRGPQPPTNPKTGQPYDATHPAGAA